jgi:hypothetical protein
MENLDLITRVGPLTSRPAKGPDTTSPFRIEVEIGNRPAVLSLSPSAATMLRGNSISICRDTADNKPGLCFGE